MTRNGLNHERGSRPRMITLVRSRLGLQQGLICAFASTFLLTGCATSGSIGTSSVGQLHNNGVEYVLTRLEADSSGEGTPSRIATLTGEYCRTIGRTCTAPIAVPSLPPSTDQIITAAGGTSAFRERLRSLFVNISGARTLQQFDRAITAYDTSAAALNNQERRRLADIVLVTRFSGRYWAPTAEGGMGGGTRPGGGGVGPAARTNWVLVAAADGAGCAWGGPLHCLQGAIMFSVAEYKRQQIGTS